MKKIRGIVALIVVLALGFGWYGYNRWNVAPAIADVPDLRDAAVRPATAADTGFTKPAVPLEGMEGVASNGKLSLYYDKDTFGIAVRDEAGNVWRSNPAKAQEDALANASVRDQLSSQLIVNYSNKTGQQSSMTSGQDSVQLKQAVAEPIEGGLKVTYTIGKASSGIDVLPKRISAERYQSLILDKVGKKYERYLFKAYKNDNNKDVYERNDKELTALALNKVIAAFKEAGYTAEDLAKDNEGAGASADREVFKAAVEYTLQDNQLVVRVPTKEIEYPGSFPLTELTVLPYFGAADTSDQGYMFVPDGSGSLIYLNNGKERYEAYTQPVYGDDGGTWNGEIDDDPTIQPIRLPVYGMKKNDAAFVAIIDQGAAVATIHAEVSRMKSSYNSVYPSFQLLAQEKINLSATTSDSSTKSKQIAVFQQRPVYSDFSVRYAFLSGDQASYTGMAAYYRHYLQAQQGLTKLEKKDSLPFYLEVVNGIPKRESFLGIPYKALLPLTTFKQTETLIGKLKEQGIDQLKVRLSGWFNKGVSHKAADHVDIDSSLGGSGGYKDLVAYAKREGVTLYPDVSFTHLYSTGGKYSESKAVSRYVNRQAAWVWERTDWARPLSARLVPYVVDRFLSAYGKYGGTGLSVRNMGHMLEGDYRRGHVVDRVQAEEIDKQQLEKIGKQLPDVMADGGNAYVLPYVKDVVEAPMTNNGYNLTDESVPFYQIVLHGFVGYSGAPLNLSPEADVKKYVLQSIEYGSNVYFKWIYASNDKVQNTDFTYLYSVNYETWFQQAVDAYNTVNEALRDVQDKPITDHRKLMEGVYRTTFEGGKSVTVNYNPYAVTVDGREIKVQDFAVGGETP
ncbi:DUF5696 domain-containing protein [Cohnella thermotolerans]|uniref:DUF5696 domain-containing protein n=1 Tax=Cohnella thermotolerans TaxID=329858 RepID=UPI00041B65B9|nr:DUF5696 domain-containing protein [Cohnella thermotolerans]